MPKKESVLRVEEYLSASALRAAGIPFLGAEKTPSGRVALLFDDSKGSARATLYHHENGTLKVDSAAMAAAVDFMKNKIFAARRTADER